MYAQSHHTCLHLYMHTRAHSAREFMAFTSEVLVGRTAAGQRQTVKEQGTLVEFTRHSPFPTGLHCWYRCTVMSGVTFKAFIFLDCRSTYHHTSALHYMSTLPVKICHRLALTDEWLWVMSATNNW